MKGARRDYAQILGFACQSVGIAVLLGITFLRLGEVSGLVSVQGVINECGFSLRRIFNLSRLVDRAVGMSSALIWLE